MNRSVLYITNARIPTEKAHGLQIVKTIEALVGEGVPVTLVLPGRRNKITEDLFSFYDVERLFHVIYFPDPFRFVERIAPEIYFTLTRAWFGTAGFLFAVWRKERIIYTRTLTLAFLLSLVPRKLVVFEDHEPKLSKRWLYRFFLSHIDRKIIVAQGLRKMYEGFGIDPQSYTCIPNGVSVEQIISKRADAGIWARTFGGEIGGAIVLYVGHFYRWKGVYTLIDAMEHIKAPASLVLIGGTSKDNAEVRSYITARAVPGVFVHDFLPHDEVITFMRSADILVLPNTAKEERSSAYTTPIKLFEYMASGVPIVASNIQSLAWYLRDRENAVLCAPDDPKDLATSIERLLQDHELGKRIASTAREEVGRYTWQARARRIIEFIEK